MRPATTTSLSATATCEAGDDDAEKVGDGIDDGFEDASDAIDHGHDAVADGLEQRADLWWIC
jgi:hypothetical protein